MSTVRKIVDDARGVVVVTVIATLCLMLTACDHSRVSAFAAQRTGDTIRIAVCEDMTMTGLTVAVGATPGVASTTIWGVDGSREFHSGDEFTVFEPLEGFEETKRFAEDRQDWQGLTVYVYGEPEGVTVFDFAEVVDGVWIRWDGSTGVNPCP